MSEVEKLFDQNNTPSNTEGREIVIRFLKDIGISLSKWEESPVECAYKIAGLMSTDFARQLTDDDPIDEILVIAGELETNPQNVAQLTQELIAKISLL